MSDQVEYRRGPKAMDVAAKLPSGWVRLANNRRLSEADVANWRELSCWDEEGPTTTLVGTEQYEGLLARVRELEALEERNLVQRNEDQNQYYRRGFDDAQRQFDRLRQLVDLPEEATAAKTVEHVLALTRKGVGAHPPAGVARHKLAPSEIRLKMLVEFEMEWGTPGQRAISMREAAERANVLSLPNYTSRFASDLVHRDWVICHEKIGHSKLFVISDKGLDELSRVRG